MSTTKRITVALTEDEYIALAHAARVQRRTVSACAAVMVRDAVGSIALQLPPDVGRWVGQDGERALWAAKALRAAIKSREARPNGEGPPHGN